MLVGRVFFESASLLKSEIYENRSSRKNTNEEKNYWRGWGLDVCFQRLLNHGTLDLSEVKFMKLQRDCKLQCTFRFSVK